MTKVLHTADSGTLGMAATLIQHGQVIAVPTDTVYGLVCKVSDAAAIDLLFQVKERPPDKPLPVLLGRADQIEQVVAGGLPTLAQVLIDRYWPGPLTLVLPAQPHLPAALTAGGTTVGVRTPDQPFLRSLALWCGPLASSSANRSGQPACATGEQVLRQLQGRIPLLVDGGATPVAQASTVLDLSGPLPRILREGPIDQDALAGFSDRA